MQPPIERYNDTRIMKEDTFCRVSPRVAVIQGWIVDLAMEKIISTSTAKKICSKDDFEKLSSCYLRDFKKIDASTNCIIDVESEVLFKAVSTVEYDFGVTKEGHNLFRPSREVSRSEQGLFVSNFSASCHKVCLAKKRTVYIRNPKYKKIAAEIFEMMVDIGPGPDFKGIDRLLFSFLIKVQEIILPENYLDAITIGNYVLPDYRKLTSKSMYMAFEKPNMSGIYNFIGNFHTGYASLIRNYNKDTLKLHGRRVGFPLYLFFNKHKLSIFQRAPAISLQQFVGEARDVETLLGNFDKLFREANKENEHYDFVLVFPTLVTDLQHINSHCPNQKCYSLSEIEKIIFHDEKTEKKVM